MCLGSPVTVSLPSVAWQSPPVSGKTQSSRGQGTHPHPSNTPSQHSTLTSGSWLQSVMRMEWDWDPNELFKECCPLSLLSCIANGQVMHRSWGVLHHPHTITLTCKKIPHHIKFENVSPFSYSTPIYSILLCEIIIPTYHSDPIPIPFRFHSESAIPFPTVSRLGILKSFFNRLRTELCQYGISSTGLQQTHQDFGFRVSGVFVGLDRLMHPTFFTTKPN